MNLIYLPQKNKLKKNKKTNKQKPPVMMGLPRGSPAAPVTDGVEISHAGLSSFNRDSQATKQRTIVGILPVEQGNGPQALLRDVNGNTPAPPPFLNDCDLKHRDRCRDRMRLAVLIPL